jgi:AcrR family transcriptional regulator
MARRGLDGAAVIAAAARVADAEGLAAVTVARVAGDLGIRGPSLYNHVAGRDGLVRGIALEAVRELSARLREAGNGRSGADALAAAAATYRTFARDHPGRYDAMQRAPATGDAELLAGAAEAVDVLTGLLRGWALEGDEAIHAVRALRSALHGFVDLERIGGFGLPASTDASFAWLVERLTAGLDARAAALQGSTTSTA